MKTPQTTKIDNLGYWLKLFLGEFLTVTRNMSHNTQMSYRDTFRMLVRFVSGKTNIAIDKLNISDISKEMVLLFLDEFIEKTRNASVSSRNQRLTAIKSFAKFRNSLHGNALTRLIGATKSDKYPQRKSHRGKSRTWIERR